jgi:DNA-binding CsgD family transcriptional regulator
MIPTGKLPTMDALFRSAVRLCQAGLNSVSLRREISALVVPALGVDAHAFSLCDPDTGLLTHTVAAGVPPRLGAEYVDRLYPTEVAPLVSRMRARRRLVFSVSEHSPVARDELTAHGIRDQLYVALVSQGQPCASWCLMRADASARTQAKTKAFLRRLAPSLSRALALAADIDAAQAPQSEAAPGVLVVDDRGRVALRTPTATSILADLADVGFPTGEPLPTAIRTAIAAGAIEMRSRGKSGQQYIVATSRAEPGADGRSATVVVIRATAQRQPAPWVAARYGLSPRERDVVAAVMRGEPTKCIAAALHLSPHTVAEHLDRACRKVGVRGRRELISRLFMDQAGGSA